MSSLVMMVDDDLDVLFAFERLFASARPDFEFLGFSDPERALASLRERTPWALVTDLRMPVLSGLEVLVQARALVADLPVVVISAFGTPEVRRELTAHQSVEFLEKPFNLTALLAAIDRAAGVAEGFSGSVALPMLPDLVQMYAIARMTGTVEVLRRGVTAEIWFDQGAPVHAVCGSLEGEAAIYELLGWTGGSIRTRVGAEAPRRTITTEWEHLLLEGCRRLDEANLPAPPLPQNEESIHSNAALAPHNQRSRDMATLKETLGKLAEIDGFMGACIVDSTSGMMLGSEGGNAGLNLEVAAAGNTEVVRAKRKTMNALGIKDSIEDILITLGRQYHLIRPLAAKDGLFAYLVLDKGRSNLALARHALADSEKGLVV